MLAQPAAIAAMPFADRLAAHEIYSGTAARAVAVRGGAHPFVNDSPMRQCECEFLSQRAAIRQTRFGSSSKVTSRERTIFHQIEPSARANATYMCTRTEMRRCGGVREARRLATKGLRCCTSVARSLKTSRKPCVSKHLCIEAEGSR
jgi:hypothetical protein